MDTMENHREQQKKDQDSKRYPIPAHRKWTAEFKSDDYGWSKKIQMFVCLAQPMVKKYMKLCYDKAGIHPLSPYNLFPKEYLSSLFLWCLLKLY